MLLQECLECDSGTFVVSPEYGCTVQPTVQDGWIGGCDRRACIKCPEGASCSKGSLPNWQHFVPDALRIGGSILPWVTVIRAGTSTRLFCDPTTSKCAPPSAPEIHDALQDDHIWEYDEDIANYILRKCPPGHRLVNSSSGGIFNPALQMCQACGKNMYIIDQYGPCQDCPEGGLRIHLTSSLDRA